MTNSRQLTISAIALLSAMSVANAQTTQGHDAHHPDTPPTAGGSANAPSGPAPTVPGQAITPGMGQMMGGGTGQTMGSGAGPMMGGGAGQMMGSGMGSMMGGGMGQMTPMMRMMRGMMMSPSAQMGQGGQLGGMAMMPTDFVDGRLAFLKTELGITEAQLPQWNAYAEALSGGAKIMRSALAAAMAGGDQTSMPARSDAMIAMMTARLEALKSTAAAGKALYAALTDIQKKRADELIMSPMGGM